MAYPFLKDFVKNTKGPESNKQMNQFRLHQDAIKPSLRL